MAATVSDSTRPRDAAATRRRILAAATDEFSAHGLAGARVERIVDAAGVNRRMLYHYFGSKEGLFEAVLEAALGAAADGAHPLADERLIRLALWEALASDGAPVAGEAARRAHWQARVAAREARKADGELPAELDARQLELALAAVSAFPVAFPQYTRMITGHGPGDAAFRESHGAFLRALERVLLRAARRPKPRVTLKGA